MDYLNGSTEVSRKVSLCHNQTSKTKRRMINSNEEIQPLQIIIKGDTTKMSRAKFEELKKLVIQICELDCFNAEISYFHVVRDDTGK